MSVISRWVSAVGALACGLALVGTTHAAGASPPTVTSPSASGIEIAVKVDLADGYGINDVTAAYPLAVDEGGLASRGIYLVHPTDPTYADDPARTAALAARIAQLDGVVYAQPDQPVRLADSQFHGWPYGGTTDLGDDIAAWLDQPAATQLRLAEAHAISQGAGVTVAVLDTGVDASHPALAGHLLPGWNYVGDNVDTADVRYGVDDDENGVADSAVGHGTFVAGIVALVAPRAKILPYRVLDSDGYGSVYAVAQAILDATAAGADVVNLSFGATDRLTSPVVADAISRAERAGVVVVGAAGNDGDNTPHYPAAYPGVLGVSALAANTDSLSGFSDWGGWAELAAPGQNVVGPVPGGGYARWSGTSMAAPFVAGQVALLRAVAPGSDADRLTAAIDHTVDTVPHHPVRFGAIDVMASLTYASGHHA